MFDVLKSFGVSFLLLRFCYWVGASLVSSELSWRSVLISQCLEGLLLFFICTQLLGNTLILPMQQSSTVESTGLLLLSFGVSGMFLAKKQLGNAWTYAAAYKRKSNTPLITNGIYAYVRHPIYSCFILSYAGAELLAGSWLWISILFFFIPFYFQAKKEETMLIKYFGKQYKKYQQTTKMFIPFLW